MYRRSAAPETLDMKEIATMDRAASLYADSGTGSRICLLATKAASVPAQALRFLTSRAASNPGRGRKEQPYSQVQPAPLG